MTRYFPELVEALRRELPERCVVDGEIVLVRGGRLDFDALQQRIHPAASRVKLLAGETPASFVAFDLLALGDDDLTGTPFGERRRALERALAEASDPVFVTPATADPAVARDWFERHLHGDFDAAEALPDLIHVFTHYRLHMQPLAIAPVAPGHALGDNADLRWIAPAELPALGLPAPIRKLLSP